MAFLSLVQAVLRAGPSQRRYADLVDVCRDTNQLFSTRVLLPVGLDVLDEFAMHPSPDIVRRQALAATALDGLQAQAARGDPTQDDRRLAELLLEELGMPSVSLSTPSETRPLQEDGDINPWPALTGKSIVLYTLLDGMGRRFEDQLRRFCSGVRVTTLSDHVASDRLRVR